MDNKSRSNATVDAVERSFEIIKELQQRDGAGVTELAAHLDMSKSGIHKHLTTLVEAGFVTQDGHEYRLSFEFLSVAQMRKTESIVYNVGAPEIDDLAEKSGIGAYLVLLEDTIAYCVYTAEGEHSVGMDTEVGDKVSFHSMCAGKAILSKVSDNRRDALLGDTLERKTDATVRDRDALGDELADIREDGIAFEDEENVYGMRGVAAPIHRPEHGTIGAVGTSGPVSLIDNERFTEELPELVLQTKNFIEVKSSLTPPTRLQ